MTKVELFEVIRRAFHHEGKSKRHIARELGIHRRTVRQAISNAVPPERKDPSRKPPILTEAYRHIIDGWLESDRDAPRKQRHTARKIFQRLTCEEGFVGAESTVRRYVGRRRRELVGSCDAHVPLSHTPGHEGEVDWYEADVELPQGRERLFFICVRACFSGREFHMAFPSLNQICMLEGIRKAFKYFGGVFKTMRFDNPKPLVAKVLRGRRRLETERFIAFRSHYLFNAEFCKPGKDGAHEKGGVEGGLGRFRRNHLTPVPAVDSLDTLNQQLLTWCQKDDLRCIDGRPQSIDEQWQQEIPELLRLPDSDFETSERGTARVDTKSRVCIKQNRYSVPVGLVGLRVEYRLGAIKLQLLHSGKVVAEHDRLKGRHQQRLCLDHYLELLRQKPGALGRSLPLRQAVERNEWPKSYQTFLESMIERQGESEGARQMVEVLFMLRNHEAADVHTALELALEHGCFDAGAVDVLLRQLQATEAASAPLVDLGVLASFERAPDSDFSAYDRLLLPSSEVLQ